MWPMAIRKAIGIAGCGTIGRGVATGLDMGDFGTLSIGFGTVRSPANTRTEVLSGLATLRRITSHIQIGT